MGEMGGRKGGEKSGRKRKGRGGDGRKGKVDVRKGKGREHGKGPNISAKFEPMEDDDRGGEGKDSLSAALVEILDPPLTLCFHFLLQKIFPTTSVLLGAGTFCYFFS